MQLFNHPVIRVLKQAYERRRKILVHLSVQIRRVIDVFVLVGRQEDTVLDRGTISALAGQASFKYVTRVHADALHGKSAAAYGAAKQLQHTQRKAYVSVVLRYQSVQFRYFIFKLSYVLFGKSDVIL